MDSGVLEPHLPLLAAAVLPSAVIFETQDPETGDPMEHFRNTPMEKKQVVRTYERFSQIVSHLLQPNGRVLVISEWGDRSVKAGFHFNLIGFSMELLRETAVALMFASPTLCQRLRRRAHRYVARCRNEATLTR